MAADNIECQKKLTKENDGLRLNKIKLKKSPISTTTLQSPIHSGCQHALYELFFYWFHDVAARCQFGVDLLCNQLDHNSFYRLTDGTPDSFSNMLYSSRYSNPGQLF